MGRLRAPGAPGAAVTRPRPAERRHGWTAVPVEVALPAAPQRDQHRPALFPLDTLKTRAIQAP